MSHHNILQFIFYLFVVVILIKPLGLYMARIYEGKEVWLARCINPLERGIYRLCSIDPKQQMNWKEYAIALLVFNFLGMIILYILQRAQAFLPLNPQHFSAADPTLAFNVATSFATNSNWQAYGGENTLSYFTQMLALTVQNFLSAASGMSILVAVIRGIKNSETSQLGNFWSDSIRSVLYILLPLSIILALLLVSQGVIQNFKDYQRIIPIQNIETENVQLIPMGPVASQVAIKQLGTNGGGYFNTNSAHPFENPTPLSNFLEMLAILLIPAAFCYTFGVLVKDTRQGWTILGAMFLIFIPLALSCGWFETQNNPLFQELGSNVLPGNGNMEGKETRFGAFNSALWASVTTATSNGSVNSMHDSFLPLGGLIPLCLMDLGEIIFGGVGSGLYQMLLFIMITVFIAGLMVGRTPEYLGKKIEAYEIKMASFAILIMPLTVLIGTAVALTAEMGKVAIGNPGPHGFSEILYAFSSMKNNNGSAFSGLNANLSFYNILGSFVMLIGRYWIAISALAIAGSLAQKKTVPVNLGTLPTNSFSFVLVLASTILILGALSFFPAFTLGPIVEHFMLSGD